MLPTQEFISRLREAAMCEAWVAAKLAASGIYVLHHPIFTAQDHAEVERFGHQYDLTLYREHPANHPWASHTGLSDYPVDVEVKSSARHFTDPYNFGLRHDKPEMYLCSQASWLKKCPGLTATPVHYFFVSHQTMAIVWVPAGTAVELGIEAHDNRRGETYRVAAFDPTCARTFREFCDAFKAA